MTTTVTYWFAVQSPFAYLGHARVREVCTRHAVTLDPKPVDIGRVFAATGGVPFGQRHVSRQEYRGHELRRWSTYLHLPINLAPKFFPVDATLAARMIIATQASVDTERALDLAGACMRAVWVEDRDIADAATLESIAQTCHLDGPSLIAAARGDAAGAAFETNTQAAIDNNIFGAPTYVFDGEPFWGQDRIDFLDRALTARGM
ncbi:MAG TPA: 2-hydroxychromene-2-carboxylate isomerase [Burkholderiaceae bacterium]|nr:2-hydroxychromene-2-carboxylate isomerase [Burkholderiaceae bacterium]